MNIVVMGGSFNPPTIAHLKIMETALNAVQAELGFWVPVSFPYLKRKMVKAGESHMCLSNELRLRLLEAMAAEDSRIRIFTEAMQDPFSDDVGFMKLLQSRYSEASLYYVAGADKLKLLNHFAEKKADFFTLFRCILFSRECGKALEEVAAHEKLAPYINAFLAVPPPEGIDGVSSTKIRQHLFDIDAVADMLHPAVVEILRGLNPQDYPEEILQFKDQYAFLSNDAPAMVAYKGIQYSCATSAFLAARVEDKAERLTISKMELENAKKKYGAAPQAPGWEDRETTLMEEIVRAKFAQHPDLADLLQATAGKKLINGSKKDEFWGTNTSPPP